METYNQNESVARDLYTVYCGAVGGQAHDPVAGSAGILYEFGYDQTGRRLAHRSRGSPRHHTPARAQQRIGHDEGQGIAVFRLEKARVYRRFNHRGWPCQSL